MASFVQLDADNVVTVAIVVNDSDMEDYAGAKSEAIGIGWCEKTYGATTNWKQSATPNVMTGKAWRGNPAGIGMTYMTGVETLGVASTDIFIIQQPYPSWSIGIGTALWYAPTPPGPVPDLTDAERLAGKTYIWSESNYNTNPATAWVLT